MLTIKFIETAKIKDEPYKSLDFESLYISHTRAQNRIAKIINLPVKGKC